MENKGNFPILAFGDCSEKVVKCYQVEIICASSFADDDGV